MCVIWTDDAEDSAVEAWRAAGHGRRCTCRDCRALAGDLAEQRMDEERDR